MNPKEVILEAAAELGFQRTVIASIEPLLEERKFYNDWVAKDYAASMEYLKRNPERRTDPRQVLPGSVSAIVVSASYYTDAPPHPGPRFGRVARYAVGLDYHAVLRAKLRELRSLLEKRLGRTLHGKPYTDDVALYEQALANRHGLGFTGKHSLIIGPRLGGTYHFIAELFTDLDLEPDEPYVGTCGACFRCGSACPTDAIVEPYSVDSRLCISFLTIENKDGIPPHLRSKLGQWVYGCDICQIACPYNQRPEPTKWTEFLPESGAGHYLDLLDVLAIPDQNAFLARFQTSAIRRPKLRGLQRNALVVLGNQKPEEGRDAILAFALNQPDPMLREHAAWALAQYGDQKSLFGIRKLLSLESEPDCADAMKTLLASC